jgi:2,3-dihydroxy-p-cumate/2,3-dihydroxybenzoate 3,4-dioxygenase
MTKRAESALALETWDEAALEEVASRLDRSGYPVRHASYEEAADRRVHAAVLTEDASGNKVEIVTRPERSGRRFFGARDAGIQGLSNVALRSLDLAGDMRFWLALGATASDYVGEIAYLALDRAHHRVALYPSNSTGLLYVAFEVATFDDLMRGHYFLSERQIKIVQGPGRQPASQQAFVHFSGPEGLIYTYVTGMGRSQHDSRPPRQFPRNSKSLCAWGSRADGPPELGIG